MATKTTEIRLLGLGNSPSDYDCMDGNLSMALNVIHEQDAIHSAVDTAPQILANMPIGYGVLYIHRNDNYSHVIFHNNIGQYMWVDEKELDPKKSLNGIALDGIPANSIKNIIGLGNTLYIQTDMKVYYFIWQDSSNIKQYTFLGNEIPELNIRFGLVNHVYRSSDKIDAFGDFDSITNLKDYGGMVDKMYKLPSIMTTDRIFERTSDYSKTLGNESDNDKSVVEEGEEEYSGNNFLPDDVKIATDAVIGEANKFNEEWCGEKGYFSQPFLVRAALRLYDGTTTRDTPPVLMLPSNKNNPIAPIMMIRKEGVYFDLHGVGCSLKYYIPSEMKDSLDKWKDIVKSIEIYVSEQFYTYNPDGKCEKFVAPTWSKSFCTYSGTPIFKDLDKSFTLSAHDNTTDEELRRLNTIFNPTMPRSDKYEVAYNGIPGWIPLDFDNNAIRVDGRICGHVCFTGNTKKTYFSTYNNNGNNADNKFYFCPVSYIPLPKREASDIENDVRNCSLFYLVESINSEDVVYDGHEVDLSGGNLRALKTKEILNCEYESHHKILSANVNVYNNRLNLIAIRKTLFDGFTSAQLLPRFVSEATIHQTDVFVFIKDKGKEYVVRRTDYEDHNWLIPILYTYYPDPNAYKMVICVRDSQGYFYRELTLREHTGFNGAIFCGELSKFPYTEKPGSWQEDEGMAYYNKLCGMSEQAILRPNHNLIYTSEVNNPFVFKAKNVEQVGNGNIIAIAPTTLPLSQGQFGFAEMYCFTTDGIWTLKVSDTGGWSAKQPFHYDVILNGNPNNLLRMERDIIFSSTRGLMMLAGSSIDCISEIFNGKQDVIISGEAWCQQAYTQWRTFIMQNVYTKIWTGVDSLFCEKNFFHEFRKFINNAVFLYDYRHQRIIIGNPTYTFSYVFSLRDKLWTSMPIKIISSVNSYPQCYAIVYNEYDKHNMLVDFSSDEFDKTVEKVKMPQNGIIITRPFKLNSASVQKTIRTINLHGSFNKAHAAMILLGCNDNSMNDWFVVSSCEGSRLPFRYGTPFKAFRLIIITRLTSGESISSFTVEYEYKELNKERQ